MPKSILICASALLACLPAVGALRPADTVLKSAEHQKVGKLIDSCIEAYVAKKGRLDAEADLRKALEKKWEKASEGRGALALTEDLEVALWHSRNYSKAKGVKKGKVNEFEVPVPFYGPKYTTTYALWAPSKYNARSGPYPLVLCIPDVDEKPEDHLKEWWADNDLRASCILVGLTMPEKVELWSSLGVRNEPENTGGYALLLTVFADVLNRYAIDFDRVFLAGRGPGVAAAMEIANASPDRFAGVIGRTGDAAEMSPDNLYNLPCFFAGAGKRATTFAEQVDELGGIKPTIVPDAKEADFLAWILETSRTGHPDTVVLRAGAPMPNKAYWIEIPPHDGQSVARIVAKVDRSSNTITIESEGIASVNVFFNDTLVDLEQPIKVICNGAEHEGTVPRNFNTTMELIYIGRSDPGKLYTAYKPYDIPVAAKDGGEEEETSED